MSGLKENLRKAKEAIYFLNNLDITSINVPFRIGSYHKSPLSRFDMFLFLHMRSEVDLSPLTIRHHVDSSFESGMSTTKRQQASDMVRSQIEKNKEIDTKVEQIINSSVSASEKKKQLKKLMEDSKFNPDDFFFMWFRTQSNRPDEARIRSAQRAIKYRHGNCGEKSAVAATWLLEHFKDTKEIFWCAAKNWDHAWAILGDKQKIDAHTIETKAIDDWDDNTIVVDGWTGDWYVAKHPYNPVKSGSLANPFQLYVRKKVQQASKQMKVNEHCKWPPQFWKDFRLADQIKTPDKAPTNSRTSKAEEVADHGSDFVNELRALFSHKNK